MGVVIQVWENHISLYKAPGNYTTLELKSILEMFKQSVLKALEKSGHKIGLDGKFNSNQPYKGEVVYGCYYIPLEYIGAVDTDSPRDIVDKVKKTGIPVSLIGEQFYIEIRKGDLDVRKNN